LLHANAALEHSLETSIDNTDEALIAIKKKIEIEGRSPEGLSIVERVEVVHNHTFDMIKYINHLKEKIMASLGTEPYDRRTGYLSNMHATIDWETNMQHELVRRLDDYVATLNSSFKDVYDGIENRFSKLSPLISPEKMLAGADGNVYVISLVLQLNTLKVGLLSYEQEVLKKFGAGDLKRSITIPRTKKLRSLYQIETRGNELVQTLSAPFSSFPIERGGASYAFLSKWIATKNPEATTYIRTEELINYFRYDYPAPTNNEPIAIHTELSECPWKPTNKLLRIGVKAKDMQEASLPTANFVFLLDVSQSMNAPEKLPLLKNALKKMVQQLRPEDRVAIVVYAGLSGVVLPSTSGKYKARILEAIESLPTSGSTAEGEGIQLAYRIALQNFVPNGNNRVILATDGDFNVGVSSLPDLQKMIEQKRQTGIYLTCLGFGMGNYRDEVMETLANKGNGNYAYIDSYAEAEKFLRREYLGSFFVVVRDVKLQVEFNPAFVESYRLIGYENRRLWKQDFAKDTSDTNEMGAGQTVTALYEITPADKSNLNKSQYQTTTPNKEALTKNEIGNIQLRYKPLQGEKSISIKRALQNEPKLLQASSDDFRFASAVAWLGLWITYPETFEKEKALPAIKALAQKAVGKDGEGFRRDFLKLLEGI
jgi:secreted protein with Ig-like and vWFA domain